MEKESKSICFSEINNDCIIIVNCTYFGRGENEKSVYTTTKTDFKKEFTGQDDMNDLEFIDFLYNDQDEFCYVLSFMNMNGDLYVVENLPED